MKILVNILIAFALLTTAFAQTDNSPAPRSPRPFVQGGINISSEGYQSVGSNVGAGVDAEEPHFVFIGEAFYDFLRKTNDNDQAPNEKGRVRTADGVLLFKAHKLLLGGGIGWDETSLTTYMKSAWTPRV